MYKLTTEQSFDAAHFLKDYNGKCSNIHGHRWRVVVTVKEDGLQKQGNQTGMVLDFGILKRELGQVIDQFDHTFLIEKGSLKKSTICALQEEKFKLVELNFRPTAENLAKYIFDCMAKRGYPLFETKVYETPNNCAYYRENEG